MIILPLLKCRQEYDILDLSDSATLTHQRALKEVREKERMICEHSIIRMANFQIPKSVINERLWKSISE